MVTLMAILHGGFQVSHESIASSTEIFEYPENSLQYIILRSAFTFIYHLL